MGRNLSQIFPLQDCTRIILTSYFKNVSGKWLSGLWQEQHFIEYYFSSLIFSSNKLIESKALGFIPEGKYSEFFPKNSSVVHVTGK